MNSAETIQETTQTTGNQLSSLQDRINELRDRVWTTGVTGVGASRLLRLRGKQLFDQAMQQGQRLKANKGSNQAADTTDESPQRLSTIKQVSNIIDRSQTLGLGLREELKARGQSWRNDIKAKAKDKLKDQPESDQTTTSTETNESNRLKLREARAGLPDWLNENLQAFQEQAMEEGKEAEYHWRKNRLQRQLEREHRRQQLLGRLGLTTQENMKEVNRRLAQLSNALEHINASEENSPMLERRQGERRQQQMAVDYERRLRERRQSDQQAA